MSEEFSPSSTAQQRAQAQQYLADLRDADVDHDVVIQRYHESSDKYDESMAVVNYSGPKETAKTLANLFPANREKVLILDVAAGTGLCAFELRKLGFKKMDAVDASKHMLNEARKKNMYDRYFTHWLGKDPLNIKDDTYDAVTICGMSTEIMKSLPVDAFEDLIRVVKPGGYIVNTGFYTTFAGDSEETDIFRGNMKMLESEGKWKQVDFIHFQGYLHGKEGGIAIHKVY